MDRLKEDKEYPISMPMMSVAADTDSFYLGLAIGSYEYEGIVYAGRIRMDYSGNILEVIDERGQGSIQG